MNLCYPSSLKAITACNQPVYSLKTILVNSMHITDGYLSVVGTLSTISAQSASASCSYQHQSAAEATILSAVRKPRDLRERARRRGRRALRINTHMSTGGKTWCEWRCKPYGTIKPYTSHLVQRAVGVHTQVCSLPCVLLDTLMHGCLPNHHSSPRPPALSRTEPLSFRTCLA